MTFLSPIGMVIFLLKLPICPLPKSTPKSSMSMVMVLLAAQKLRAGT